MPVARTAGDPLPPAPPQHLPQVDALRGIAALVVALFVHFYHMQTVPLPPGRTLPGLDWIYTNGTAAVDLFFVISGFIFCHVYLVRDGTAGAVRLRGDTSAAGFAIDRVARLYPLHLATLLAVAALAFACRWLHGHPIDEFPNDLRHFVLNLLFLQRSGLERNFSFNHPAWSLSVEALCYLLFFLAARFAPRRFFAIALVMIGAGLLCPSRFIGRGLAGFFTGCLVYRWRGGLGRVHGALLAAACVAGLAVMGRFGSARLIRPDMQLTLLVWPWLLALAFRPWPARLLCWRPLRILGDLSLSTYLLHVPVQLMLILALGGGRRFDPADNGWLWPLYALAVLGLSWLSFHRFERPARRWVKRQGRRLVAARPQPVPADAF